MITNNIHKIIKPLISRFTVIQYDFENKEVRDEMIPQIKERLKYILESQNIKYKEKGIDSLIERFYPDIRSMVKILQKEYSTFGQISEVLLQSTNVDEELYGMIMNRNITAARKFIVEKSYDYGILYSKLFREFIPLVKEKPKQAQIMLAIEQYMDKHTTSLDPEITFTACLLEIVRVL